MYVRVSLLDSLTATIYIQVEREYYEFLKGLEEMFEAVTAGEHKPTMEVEWMEETFYLNEMKNKEGK